MEPDQIKSMIKQTIKQSIDRIPKTVVGVSNRHIHLSKDDQEILFGDKPLTPIKELLAGNFAAAETVTINGPKGTIKNVRVLGPSRSHTQVEVSLTDTFILGIKASVCESGKLEKAVDITITNPLKGVTIIRKAAIIALRHIHMSVDFANKHGFKDKQMVSVRFYGERGLVFDNTLLRIDKDFTDEMHIDTDEANSGGIKSGDIGFIEV
ncbi:MAG: phosphate propanoyltransferase [Defluviitaleaceae bacterium]|nr:phosphate propanoyltransferase [Defluviitaleaceae bacterium]